MSRCYPFPPPGYVRNESLIESIKGTKEEFKREKRHSKHKKDKKRKERADEAELSKKHHHHKRQRRKDESVKATKKVDDSEVVELREKSCLTMELELQTSSQNSCDSTLRSNVGPKQVQSQQTLDGMHNDSASTNEAPRDALRVSSEKRKDTIFGSPREISAELGKEKKAIPIKDGKSRETKGQPSMKLGEEKPSSSHQEAIVLSKQLCSKCRPSTAALFLNLIENWTPDRVKSKLTDSEDRDLWLLMKSGAKRQHQVSNQTTTINGSSSSTAWPAARFLPEVEVYALPYAVPF
ncbi:unnamed protein product [Cochlearia groenlandica]